MTQESIETYTHTGEGFNPFLIRKGWQVAQLNYMPQQGFQAITRVECHQQTDEVFILLNGKAILIVGKPAEKGFDFQYWLMQPGITYNIPMDTWHNIAMDKDAQVMIVEASNTHLMDVAYRDLNPEEKTRVLIEIDKTLNSSL